VEPMWGSAHKSGDAELRGGRSGSLGMRVALSCWPSGREASHRTSDTEFYCRWLRQRRFGVISSQGCKDRSQAHFCGTCLLPTVSIMCLPLQFANRVPGQNSGREAHCLLSPSHVTGQVERSRHAACRPEEVMERPSLGSSGLR
jgi:hypothetical protein